MMGRLRPRDWALVAMLRRESEYLLDDVAHMSAVADRFDLLFFRAQVFEGLSVRRLQQQVVEDGHLHQLAQFVGYFIYGLAGSLRRGWHRNDKAD